MLRRYLSAVVLVTAVTVGLVQPASAGASGVLFGASVAPASGETFAQAVTRQDTAYGTMPISRVFYAGAAQPWTTGNAGVSGRPVVVSFKYTPIDVIKGLKDAALKAFFAGAPSTYDVYWSYIHEPEDNIARGEFTAADYKAAWQHIADLAQATAPTNTHLHSTLILMCYTMNPASGRNWTDYYQASAQSMIAFDCYNHAGKRNTYGDPANIFKPVINWSAANPTIPWAISEVGSTLGSTDNGTKRADWLRSVGSFLVAQHADNPLHAIFGIYFDTAGGGNGTDYRLVTDPYSQPAWQDVVQNY